VNTQIGALSVVLIVSENLQFIID